MHPSRYHLWLKIHVMGNAFMTFKTPKHLWMFQVLCIVQEQQLWFATIAILVCTLLIASVVGASICCWMSHKGQWMHSVGYNPLTGSTNRTLIYSIVVMNEVVIPLVFPPCCRIKHSLGMRFILTSCGLVSPFQFWLPSILFVHLTLPLEHQPHG